MEPSKVRELLAVLKEFGVTHFQQGDLHISLASEYRSASDSPQDQALQNLADLARAQAR